MRPVPRGPLAAAVLACVTLASVAFACFAFGAGPAPPQAPPPESAALQDIGERYQELLRTAADLDRTNADLKRNREAGTRLADMVKKLKEKPAGMWRDADLQDALRKLRGAIAEERNLRATAAAATLRLRTKRLLLAREAGKEAEGRMKQGEWLVEADDLESARNRFETAYDLLTLPVEVPREAEPMPGERPDPKVDLRPRGDESPEELRVLALILRDGADRAAYNAQLRGRLLVRLRDERATVRHLLDLTPPPSAARADVGLRLDARIREVQGEIGARARAQGGLLAEAVRLEQTADLNEFIMLKEATLNAAAAPRVATP